MARQKSISKLEINKEERPDSLKKEEGGNVEGMISNIQRYCIHDGPGVRTTVFLKGCPLQCLWCCNPESINSFPELGFVRVLCNACGMCLESCPEGAISSNSESGAISIDRARCNNCGKCIETCYRGALKMYGRRMSVAEVFEEVLHDRTIYMKSGGGLTVSGGEALLQSRFVIALFKMARQAGIHTAIETSGHASSHILEEVLRYTDYIMYDFKMIGSSSHCKVTGKTNKLILKNAELVALSGLPVLPRMPLVPGINDLNENIQATAELIRSLGLLEIELMPYHEFASGKYKALGRTYPLAGIEMPSGESIKKAEKIFESFGVECKVSV